MRRAIACALLATACNKGSDDYVWMDDDLPSENCPATEAAACATGSGTAESSGSGSESGSGSGESTAADACEATADCGAGLVCVAPFDGETKTAGELACVPGCIGIMDEASWCADAAACCDMNAECTDRGYCVHAG